MRFQELQRELGACRTAAAQVRGRRDELTARQSAIEAELADVERRLSDLDRRLHSGEVTATRELTAMVDQVELLKRRRSELEDADLELMELADPLDAELAALADRAAALDADASAAGAALAAAEREIDAEIEVRTADRARVSTAVPRDLLGTYERLRARLGGVGAARLVGSSCSGCHLALPATELERIRHARPDELITCEQCGRILVP
jgi:predicted  nucleic acid-binding Zn-ribbon protein